MRFLTVVCALALVFGLATAASAEVQNVKVSGDLSMYSFWRNDYDLDGDTATDNAENYFTSIAELQVGADLTDNVSTLIRLVNQRDWDDPHGTAGATVQYDVILDLAYVELKEMLYSPLTLKIGRQDLWFGKGLIVGAKLRDPKATIAADEYTAITSFDAIRATLDYDPWIIDLVYSKIEENLSQGTSPTGTNDDVDLYGANVGYTFDSYKGEAEAYIWSLNNRTATTYTNTDGNEIDTVGVRGSFDPVEDATIAAEGAFQFGNYAPAANTERDREAYALDLSGEYRWPDARWTPKIGLEYIYLSGEKDDADADSGDWNAWHPVYVGKKTSRIRQWHNVYYNTITRANTTGLTYEESPDQDAGVTNQHQISVSGSVVPTESLMLEGVFSYFWFDAGPRAASSDEAIGTEIDLTATYDYTEDVTFSLLAAWFLPGDYFPGGQDDTATDLVGSMKVSF